MTHRSTAWTDGYIRTCSSRTWGHRTHEGAGGSGCRDDGGQPRRSFDCVGVAAAGEPVGQHQVAALGEHRLGVELHALDRQRPGAAVAMITPDSVRPVTSSSAGTVSGSTASEW